MALSKAQNTIIEKARAVGGGQQGVMLTNSVCSYLIAVIAQDLEAHDLFPELPSSLPPFFGGDPLETLELPDMDFPSLAERLFLRVPDADTYFASLAKLHKARLKYKRILETQPIPTVEQVGPRALLEFGKLSSGALAALLFWRKWIFDIDNRAAQETGYLFEPIIASAIGGVPVSARRSPIRRHNQPTRGRQVDCVIGERAYEFKLRVTIAASGQGRWGEELTFPQDCKESGYTPVLVVLDPTPNAKLSELVDAFSEHGGEVYLGDSAWKHLNDAAGPVMGIFLDRYVHGPIQSLLDEAFEDLPNITFSTSKSLIMIDVGSERVEINRGGSEDYNQESNDPFPLDIDEELPGL